MKDIVAFRSFIRGIILLIVVTAIAGPEKEMIKLVEIEFAFLNGVNFRSDALRRDRWPIPDCRGFNSGIGRSGEKQRPSSA